MLTRLYYQLVFTRLVASAPDRPSPLSRRALLAALAAHGVALLLILSVGHSLRDQLPGGASSENVTYVSIAELDERLQVREDAGTDLVSPEDKPTVPVDQEGGPALERTESTGNESSELPAGFQELREPVPVLGIPDSDLPRPQVLAEDFRGRGAAGGHRRGTLRLPAGDGEARATDDGRVTLQGQPVVVDRMPELRNLNALADLMAALYPPIMEELRVEATVVARFVVLETGRVQEESIEIVSTTEGAFREPTRRLLLLLEWEPYRRNRQALAVPLEVPIHWVLP